MFSFEDVVVDGEVLGADFYFCLFDFHEYFLKYIKRQPLKLESYVCAHLAYQLNLKIKNEFLSLILVHEFDIAKKAAVIPSKDGMIEFVFLTNTKEWKDYLFNKYIGLKERLINWVDNTVKYLSFFFKCLALDSDIIYDKFGVKSNHIDDIFLFEGDVHNTGKFVIRLLYNNVNIYFKPRDANNEIFLEELITFFNKKTDIEAVFPNFISFDDHSWADELKYSNNFKTQDEVKKYYENIGKLTTIFYLLGTSDIIPDNIIITNNKPGFFDLEVITTRSLLLKGGTVRDKFTNSVKRIGILPEMMCSNINDNDWIMSSVLFRFNSQRVFQNVWNQNNEELEYVPFNYSSSEDSHIPMMNGIYKELTPDLLDAFIKGFKLQYFFIINHKEGIYNFILSKSYIIKKVRVIFHPTTFYSQIRNQSYIPEFYKKNNNLYELIQVLVKGFYTDNYSVDKKQLSRSIYRQILQFDIPYFYLNISTNSLYDGVDQRLSHWDFNPKTQFLDNISKMCKKDCEDQVNIINLSCNLILDKIESSKNDINIVRKLPIKDSGNYDSTVLNKDLLLKAASVIGDYLLSKAIVQKDGINWVSKVRGFEGRYTVSLLNYDLYDGLSGMCLLFVHLNRITNEIRYRDAAERIYESLKSVANIWSETHYIKRLPKEMQHSFPISPYSFPASLIYLTFQAEYFNIDKNWKIINSIIKDLIFLNYTSKHNDYLLGRFGLLDMLLSLKNSFHETCTQLIDKLINELIYAILKNSKNKNEYVYWEMQDIRNVIAVGGFSHGSSSSAYVLARAKNELKDEKLTKYICGALAYDRSFFDQASSSWLDNREDGNIKNDPVAWCHGTSGVILGRILMSQFIQDKKFAIEYRIAENNILAKGLHLNDSICHGSLGNLEVLYSLISLTGHQYLKHGIFQYLNTYSKSIIENTKNFKNGSGGNTEIIGLFTGIAGAAFQLLRFYNWETTPSVLCIETPKSFNPILHEI